MRKAYRVKPSDNVAMLLEDAAAGEIIIVGGASHKKDGDVQIRAAEAIPAGHKVALTDIDPDEEVLKYGAVIGAAAMPVRAGEHVHTHNLGGLRGRGDRT